MTLVTDVIVALDYASGSEAMRMVERLGDQMSFYKVGLELYTRAGPSLVRDLSGQRKRVFLDLKLHDIPNTVTGAVRAARDLGVQMLTVHTSGGRAMMEIAAEAAGGEITLLGVTLLTSLSPSDLEAVWGRSIGSLREDVVRLATLAKESGVNGIVASPQEAQAIRRRLGKEVTLVTPGIRLPGGEAHDQARFATPAQAARAGADYLVVGRAVTAAADPVAALEKVRRSLEGPARSKA
jgi:orotidine-5'-phosphate decarboxylase